MSNKKDRDAPARKANIPLPDQKILWGRAASLCSYRHPITNDPCRRELVHEAEEGPGVVVAENAHIEGEKPTAARYRASMTDRQRNCYDNLILLCREHHKVVDDEERTYTADRLRQDKEAHETWVRSTLLPQLRSTTPRSNFVSEDVHSTIFHVQMIPQLIYACPCSVRTERTLKKRTKGHGLPPLVLRDGKLYTFANLSSPSEHLAPFLTLSKLETVSAPEWDTDPDKRRYFADLLRRCLNKIAGRRGLFLDKKSDHFYFQPTVVGKERSISYRSVGGKDTRRKVVWRPTIKATGEPRKEWVHRAVRLRFHRAAPGTWFLSLRPEFHFTTDGIHSISTDRIGSKSTKRKSRMFNYDLLSEVHFWRTYLGDAAPRIILDLGGQSLVISCVLERVQISWPGVPEDAKPFKTADIEEDIFSVAGLEAVLREEGELELAQAAKRRGQ